MNLNVYQVRGDIPEALGACQVLLDRVFKRFPGEFSWEQVLENCREGYMQLWIINEGPEPPYKACGLTRIHTLPGKKILELVAFSSLNFAEVIGYYDLIEEWARNLGCNEVEIRGRPGFIRALRIQDFKVKHVTLVKSIPPPRYNS